VTIRQEKQGAGIGNIPAPLHKEAPDPGERAGRGGVHLSPRLALLASLVPPGARVADVGTDHGYLPVWLTEHAAASSVIASDLRPGPLHSARRSAAAAGVEEKIRFVLADGLTGVAPGEADTVILAGMGGDTIEEILGRAPWTRGDVLLLLQPMSKADRLRRWLWENGYRITGEHLVRDGGKLYSVLAAVGGTQREPGPAELLTGRFEQVCAQPLFPACLEELIGKADRAVRGLRAAEKNPAPERLAEQETIYRELLEMKERLHHGESL